jgi:hypothetical protein
LGGFVGVFVGGGLEVVAGAAGGLLVEPVLDALSLFAGALPSFDSDFLSAELGLGEA